VRSDSFGNSKLNSVINFRSRCTNPCTSARETRVRVRRAVHSDYRFDPYNSESQSLDWPWILSGI
jgi:hypothetical protein